MNRYIILTAFIVITIAAPLSYQRGSEATSIFKELMYLIAVKVDATFPPRPNPRSDFGNMARHSL
jgi:hypothetical protein